MPCIPTVQCLFIIYNSAYLLRIEFFSSDMPNTVAQSPLLVIYIAMCSVRYVSFSVCVVLYSFSVILAQIIASVTVRKAQQYFQHATRVYERICKPT